MTGELRHLHLRGATGRARTAVDEQGRQRLVVPIVALVGDLAIHAVNSDCTELVPLSALSRAPHEWLNMPVVLGHPAKDGRQISAHDPTVLEKHGFGTIANPRIENSKLCVEAWIDESRAEKLGGTAFLEDLRAGKMLECSVGAFVQTREEVGNKNGRDYRRVWETIQPDHLAILIGEGARGACSINDMCGVNRAAQFHLVTAEGFELETADGFLDTPAQAASEEAAEDVQYETMRALFDQVGASYTEASSLINQLIKQNGGTDEAAETELEAAKVSALQTLLAAMQGSINAVSALCFKANPAIYPGQEMVRTFSALAGTDLTARITAVNKEVQERCQAMATGLSNVPSYAYATQVFDTSCIVQKDDKFYAMPYDVDADGVVTLGEPTEVKQEYVAAAMKMMDCPTCDGSGNKDGNPCPTCDGKGEMKAMAGARHSAEDRQMIQTTHDHMVQLGAECTPGNYKMAEQQPALKAACRCQEGDKQMKFTKEQRAAAIKSLTENTHSGFTTGDEPILDAASDERLEAFTVAAAARTQEVADLKAASDKLAIETAALKAASTRVLTTEEFMAVAPADLKTLIEESQAAKAARKTHLVTELKAAQSEYTEAELSTQPLEQLERNARMLKLGEDKPSYIGRPAPRAAETHTFDAPDPYAEAIKVLQARAN